jgi:hypothetical protein
MTQLKALLLMMGLALYAPATIQAQHGTSLISEVVTSIQQKAPEWTLVDILEQTYCPQLENPSEFGKFDYVFQHWRSSESELSIMYFISDTPEDAIKLFKGEKLSASSTTTLHPRTFLKGSVVNLGDENFLWRIKGYPTNFGVTFRKKRVVISIEAKTLDTAKQFALLITDALPTK